ncbi:hypothetical protein [Metapseudomonas otitidis]|uniref:hypothetical protein n=1 Tax=Metapseudomonas otitidis TaxID=319939 RepID=UPI0013F5BE34|nr:hypothetical protein [Pseudomonas otitidis]
MPELVRVDDWSEGMNNLAQVDRIPPKQVRDLLNLDPVGGGGLQQRAGQRKVADLAGAHGAVPYRDGLLVAAGGNLLQYSATTNELRTIGAAPATGGLCGAELNGDAFLCSAIDMIRVRGDQVGPWGLPEIMPRVVLSSGNLPAGIYRVAVTALDRFGAESGAAPLLVTLEAPGSIDLLWTAPAGATSCRIYASVANGETLYLQSSSHTDGFSLTSVTDSSARLTTTNLVQPPVATHVTAYKGRLVLVVGSALWITEPFAPHLVNPAFGFVQYGAAIDMVAVNDAGIFIAAGQRTYLLMAPGTEDASQRDIFGFGAVRGSGVTLPGGQAAWMTHYGMAIAQVDGTVSLPQQQRYAPSLAAYATSGVVDNNGLQMLVTTMKGPVAPNTLGVEDSFDMEIE